MKPETTLFQRFEEPIRLHSGGCSKYKIERLGAEMNEAELAEIGRRITAWQKDWPLHLALKSIREDSPRLLAEVRRLKGLCKQIDGILGSALDWRGVQEVRALLGKELLPLKE